MSEPAREMPELFWSPTHGRLKMMHEGRFDELTTQMHAHLDQRAAALRDAVDHGTIHVEQLERELAKYVPPPQRESEGDET